MLYETILVSVFERTIGYRIHLVDLLYHMDFAQETNQSFHMVTLCYQYVLKVF